MLKKLTLALALGSLVPGLAYACGSGCGSGADCQMNADGCAAAAMTSAPTTAAAKPPATAARPTRSYRSYSYSPSSGAYRSYRAPMMGGFSSGVRGAGSKAVGNYGR